MPSVEIAGVPISLARLDTALRTIDDLRSRAVRSGFACFCNVHSLVESRRLPNLKQALRAGDFTFADGAPIALLARLRGGRAAGRVAGPDVFSHYLQRALSGEVRIGIVGGDARDLERVRQRAGRYVGHSIHFFPLPMLGVGQQLSAEIVRSIASADCELLFLCVGCPKQEILAYSLRPQVNAFILCVGGALAFEAKRLRRAPRMVQNVGMEWAFRLLQEPARLAGRYLVSNARFAALLLAGRV